MLEPRKIEDGENRFFSFSSSLWAPVIGFQYYDKFPPHFFSTDWAILSSLPLSLSLSLSLLVSPITSMEKVRKHVYLSREQDTVKPPESRCFLNRKMFDCVVTKHEINRQKRSQVSAPESCMCRSPCEKLNGCSCIGQSSTKRAFECIRVCHCVLSMKEGGPSHSTG